MAGFRIVATASKRNHELVKGLGAEYVFEYKDTDECIKNIKSVVGDDLRVGLTSALHSSTSYH